VYVSFQKIFFSKLLISKLKCPTFATQFENYKIANHKFQSGFVNQEFGIYALEFLLAGVAKLVDVPDLGSGAVRHGGSSPSTRTNYREKVNGLIG
jgi:hypothetical protein